jgi:hypothetical protein
MEKAHRDYYSEYIIILFKMLVNVNVFSKMKMRIYNIICCFNFICLVVSLSLNNNAFIV